MNTETDFSWPKQAVILSQSINVIGREVCSRRARKLRKRGVYVQFHHNTVNGKARYTWIKRWITVSGYFE